MPERDGGFAFGGRERERHVGKEVMEQIFCEPIAVILMPGLVFLLAMFDSFLCCFNSSAAPVADEIAIKKPLWKEWLMNGSGGNRQFRFMQKPELSDVCYILMLNRLKSKFHKMNFCVA